DLTEDRQGFLSARAHHNVIAQARQLPLADICQCRLVIDQQNTLMPCEFHFLDTDGRTRGRVTAGEIHCKRRSLPNSTLHGNNPTVVGHNAMHHGQPQACAGANVLRCKKWLKDALDNLWGHPSAGIAYSEPYIRAGSKVRTRLREIAR